MTTDPVDPEVAFRIIAAAGSARSSAMLAIRESREAHFDEAARLLAEADECLHEAHRAQTGLLVDQARGEGVALDLILVHAQDHLAGAMLVRDLADEFVDLNRRMAALQDRVRDDDKTREIQ